MSKVDQNGWNRLNLTKKDFFLRWTIRASWQPHDLAIFGRGSSKSAKKVKYIYKKIDFFRQKIFVSKVAQNGQNLLNLTKKMNFLPLHPGREGFG